MSCRNVLIYLAAVQKNIIPLFHYALRPTGFLHVGDLGNGDVSGSVFGDRPRTPDLRQAGNRAEAVSVSQPDRVRPSAAARGEAPRRRRRRKSWDGVDVRQEVDRILLSRYSPAGVVVDDELEVLEIRGKANDFLTLPAGKVSFNLLKLIPDTSLFLEVEKLIHQVQSSWRARAARPHSVRSRRAARRSERGGDAAARQAKELAAGAVRTRARRAMEACSRGAASRWSGTTLRTGRSPA